MAGSFRATASVRSYEGRVRRNGRSATLTSGLQVQELDYNIGVALMRPCCRDERWRHSHESFVAQRRYELRRDGEGGIVIHHSPRGPNTDLNQNAVTTDPDYYKSYPLCLRKLQVWLSRTTKPLRLRSWILLREQSSTLHSGRTSLEAPIGVATHARSSTGG